jgi:hypothetical protein
MKSEVERNTGGTPRLSVVVVGRDGIATLVPILACLGEQTIAKEIEVIAVLPAEDRAEEALTRFSAPFQSARIVGVGTIRNRGRAAAVGVRLARAPVVAFTENHCFPDPDWAERLCAVHEGDGDHAGVAPAVLNANPETALSWAIYGAGYAVFGADGAPCEVEEMPLHNTSYRRAALMAHDNELEELLEHEGKLQARLRGGGGSFLLMPAARTRHINEGTWVLVLGLNVANGWRYGGRRGADWGLVRRVLYAAAFPLLSVNVMRETLRRLRACAERPRLGPALLGVIALQSLAHTAGEAIGYLRGPRDTFPFVDLEEFMILERLGGRPLKDRRIAAFAADAVPVEGSLFGGRS